MSPCSCQPHAHVKRDSSWQRPMHTNALLAHSVTTFCAAFLLCARAWRLLLQAYLNTGGVPEGEPGFNPGEDRRPAVWPCVAPNLPVSDRQRLLACLSACLPVTAGRRRL